MPYPYVPPAAGSTASNTEPLVEVNAAGTGHVPYVRKDPTDTGVYTGAENATIGVLREILDVLNDVRDECRATRLAVQELANEGNLTHTDFLDAALSIRDGTEEFD